MERMVLLFLWSKSVAPPQTQVTVGIWSVSFSVPKWQMGSLSHFLCRPSLLTFQGCSRLSLPSSVDFHLQAHSRICRALCGGWGLLNAPPAPSSCAGGSVVFGGSGEQERSFKCWVASLSNFMGSRKLGPPLFPLLVTIIGLYLTLLFFILDKWKHAWGCFLFFFLPQFSKDSDASGLAPTLSINQFKSNKCGIFSSSCVHSRWLRKAVWGCFFSCAFFPTWTGFMNVQPPFFPPDSGFRFSPPHPLCFPSSSRPPRSCFLTCLTMALYITPTFHHFQNVVESKRKILLQNYWLLFVA